MSAIVDSLRARFDAADLAHSAARTRASELRAQLAAAESEEDDARAELEDLYARWHDADRRERDSADARRWREHESTCRAAEYCERVEDVAEVLGAPVPEARGSVQP